MQILKHLFYSYIAILFVVSQVAVLLCSEKAICNKENIICPQVLINN